MTTWNCGEKPEGRNTLRIVLLFLCAVSAFRLGAANEAGKSDSSAQVISLGDDIKLTFLGVTRGRHHVAPRYEDLHTGNWIYTPGDATVVWIEAAHTSRQRPSYQLLVSDKAMTGCVPVEQRSWSHVKVGLGVQGFVLNAFPRWDKETVLRVRPFDGPIAAGKFVFTNAPFEPTADWKSEKLPITKSDDDLEVTLTNLSFGALVPYWRGRPAPENDPANQCVRLAFGARQNGRSATNWHSWIVRTSDDAGNKVSGSISGYPPGGIYEPPQSGKPYEPKMDGYFFKPGLWPDHSPWKIRIEFTRTSGFSDEEILTLTNLPVRVGTQQESDDQWTWEENSTNITFTPATVNGVHVKVLEPLRVPDTINGGHFIRIIAYTDLPYPIESMRLKVLEATDEQGHPLQSNFNPSTAGHHFNFSFERVPEIKKLNLKFALHKSRFVEFTAKPTKS